MGHAIEGLGFLNLCGCSSVVEHLLAKENVESSNLFIRFLKNQLLEYCLSSISEFFHPIIVQSDY